ncbi:hypothetical protein Glove_149g85 [Diversispora epigaea]|uniref:Uncharacterized protein n=1 Tax=Diversispora epigaea TaxID=1348612 RepID=A0A397IY66_9GLOM|nr:hypothetical protein Glove_149g85 [Diversispora epigaea]
MTLEALQHIWVIDENLAWDNLIYLAVGRVEYLNQLIRIEGLPLPPEIVEARNKKAIEQSLRLFISEKLVGYMNQDKKKDEWSSVSSILREFNLSVDYILKLKDLQENKCELCLNEMLWEWDIAIDSNQWTVDWINNDLGHIEGNILAVNHIWRSEGFRVLIKLYEFCFNVWVERFNNVLPYGGIVVKNRLNTIYSQVENIFHSVTLLKIYNPRKLIYNYMDFLNDIEIKIDSTPDFDYDYLYDIYYNEVVEEEPILVNVQI